MCGIFGIINQSINSNEVKELADHARQRGRDSSGLVLFSGSSYHISKADHDIKRLLKENELNTDALALGHSRLITNGLTDNQPVVRDDIFVLHNGIITNTEEIWGESILEPKYEIDSEAILAITIECLNNKKSETEIIQSIMSRCCGTVSCMVGIPKLGKLLLCSNNGSLYTGKKNGGTYISSEEFPLCKLNCKNIMQVDSQGASVEIPLSSNINISEKSNRTENLIPSLQFNLTEEKLLKYPDIHLRRCTKCILPESMPYIAFDEEGVCNYCINYKERNNPKPVDEILELVEPYRRSNKAECIIPFSGGRDSCWGLHLVVKELHLRPITYTYDWGMVTDLGRRNISRMCSILGVENIIIADDISKKRLNIRKNLTAWLKHPNLGMVSILTAGDKHFFRHVETVKKQTGINLNLWGVNPLEVTHFKAGYLGIKPNFDEKRVYTHGVIKQIEYQSKRFKAMFESPGYFNSSLWDTLSGEYYRSFTEKKDYFHIYDYWRWDEDVCNKTLQEYDWELAPDTNTTWRIGDGTAAFYNYIYYLAVGFTEHDTFRSNQIREGQMSREKALELVEDENKPRYQNIRWYLDAINMDYSSVIKRINNYYS